MCNFEQPEKPALSYSSEEIIVPDGKYTFTWTNPKKNKDDMCGIKLNYTYKISVSLDNNSPDYKDLDETSTTRDIDTGTYYWKMTTHNGIYSSETSSASMRFCVPKDIP